MRQERQMAKRSSTLIGISVGFVLCAAAAFGAPAGKPGLDPDIRLPKRIFTPEVTAQIKEGGPASVLFKLSKGWAENARARYENIPLAGWKDLISPFAPVSTTGMAKKSRGKCPFCGRPFQGCSMDWKEFAEAPFQAKTRCCGNTVYARKRDMPADYPAKPNHTESIPHLDGSSYGYECYVPPGKEKDRTNWFFSAGEVWRARQDRVSLMFFTLGSAVLFNDDERAALHLAAILDRLAEVVPGYPLYDSKTAHGLARGRDGKGYLTREEYLSVPRPQRFERPFWYHWGTWHLAKWPASSRFGGWHDGVMYWAGVLATAFDLIRDRPEVRAWSESRYGDPDAFEKRVRDGVFKEYQLP